VAKESFGGLYTGFRVQLLVTGLISYLILLFVDCFKPKFYSRFYDSGSYNGAFQDGYWASR